MPLLGFAQAATGGHFDGGGYPAGKGWDEVGLPAVNDEHAYALEISGDSMKPAYRDGDVIVVSPGTPIRRGDRVVVKTTGGEVMVKELKRRTAKTLELDRSIRPMSTARWHQAMSNGSRGLSGRASKLSFPSLPGLEPGNPCNHDRLLAKPRWMRGQLRA